MDLKAGSSPSVKAEQQEALPNPRIRTKGNLCRFREPSTEKKGPPKNLGAADCSSPEFTSFFGMTRPQALAQNTQDLQMYGV